MSRVPPIDERELHARALQKDPLILVDLLKAVAKQIEGFVRHDLKCDEETAYDAVIDVLYAYVEAPSQYDPNKGRLVTYLTKAAKHRVRDLLKSGDSRTRREGNYASSVELWQTPSKDILENFVEASRAVERLKKRLSERDLAVLRLILSGESSTEVLARALGLDPSSPEEMRREVKRHRDRLMKVLERLGKEDSDDPA
ncbi:RNA polymerase sigma factor [Cystobacter fuscus]|uniref:RNA polymerase sigma factor n=1 Tax=Cystobacter fuscus TaxID=43 RepID=UPI0037C1106F